jgi:C2 domain
MAASESVRLQTSLPDAEVVEQFFLALENKDAQEVRTLLTVDAALANCKMPGERYKCALFVALRTGTPDVIVSDLLEAGANPMTAVDSSGFTVAHEMAKRGHVQRVVDLFLAGKVANVKSRGDDAVSVSDLLEAHDEFAMVKSHFELDPELRPHFDALGVPKPSGRWRCAVEVLRARKLAAKDRGGSSDPYYYIGPTDATGENIVRDGKRRLGAKSAVVKKCLSPEFAPLAKPYVVQLFAPNANSSVTIELFDHDRVTSDDYLGHVTLPLVPLLVVPGANVSPCWLPLRKASHLGDDYYISGDVFVHLRFSAA